MADKLKAKKKIGGKTDTRSKAAARSEPPNGAKGRIGPASMMEPRRREALHRMLMAKRQELMTEIEGILSRSLTEDQQRRWESAKDIGDQALMDLERELGISMMEMRNRRRQLIDEALTRLAEGRYGLCEDCGVEISERRLVAVPFAKLCVECQTRQELIEKIEKGEERD